MPVDSAEFYAQYHGHSEKLLDTIFEELVASRRLRGETVHVVFLAGDSSMDNKYWLGDNQRERAVNGFEAVLEPPWSKPDIAHHVNKALAHAAKENKRDGFVCLNCAVEESTIGCRDGGKLLPQDEFIRQRITKDDILIVSAGGNDIALRPTCSTAVAMAWLSIFSGKANIVKGSAWGLGHFRSLFCDSLCGYVNSLTSKNKPMMFVPSVIYYPDENVKAQSWASPILKLIGYNSNPRHVQAIIDRVFTEVQLGVTPARVGIPSVVPLALSAAMDGTKTEDYVARVEPSAVGGSKIANLFVSTIMSCLN